MQKRARKHDDPNADGAFTYHLPPELIAQDPPVRRRDSKLLVTQRGGGVLGVHPFADLPELLQAGDLLVINDSRVLPARLATRRADTGGRVELLLLQPVEEPAGAWSAMARPARRLRPGMALLSLPADDPQTSVAEIELIACCSKGEVVIRLAGGDDLLALAVRHGEVPLPPYIRRDPAAVGAHRRRRRDRERYQTVYARTDTAGTGSVAAPTAGLHFDQELMDLLDRRGIQIARVTLHVGTGTFRNPTEDQIASGLLHGERFCFPAVAWARLAACRERAGRVVAVGTTSLRVLETVWRLDLPASAPDGTRIEYGRRREGENAVFEGLAVRSSGGWKVEGQTSLFIQPPDSVGAADILLTNFHLPGSSLLRLVAAFTGDEAWRTAYREAVASRLRFYSYGDAMLIMPFAEASR